MSFIPALSISAGHAQRLEALSEGSVLRNSRKGIAGIL